jgi:hypothetical protein
MTIDPSPEEKSDIFVKLMSLEWSKMWRGGKCDLGDPIRLEEEKKSFAALGSNSRNSSIT